METLENAPCIFECFGFAMTRNNELESDIELIQPFGFRLALRRERYRESKIWNNCTHSATRLIVRGRCRAFHEYFTALSLDNNVRVFCDSTSSIIEPYSFRKLLPTSAAILSLSSGFSYSTITRRCQSHRSTLISKYTFSVAYRAVLHDVQSVLNILAD